MGCVRFGPNETVSDASGAGAEVQCGGSPVCPGVVQGMITGIRGLCNGLGPALYGFIFFLFNVELNDNPAQSDKTTPLHNLTDKVRRLKSLVL